MATVFTAEQARLPSSDQIRWVVIDQDWTMHREASDYLASLDGGSRSVNTIRVYAGRIASFLTWCSHVHVSWRDIPLNDLIRYKRSLLDQPMPRKPSADTEPPRPAVYRTGKTVNAHLITVAEYFRYCATAGFVSKATADLLSEPRQLDFVPAGRSLGENGQYRKVRSRLLRTDEVEEPINVLTDEEIARIEDLITNNRDRFLFRLLLETGVRIGEALGLRREDMHFMADSRSVGCAVSGPHVHVRRRANNSNKALAKARKSRHVPVGRPLVQLYADYMFGRDTVPEAQENDFVFVNLYQQPLGRAMSYSSVSSQYKRLAKESRTNLHPHALRHTCATTWLRNGVDRDVVQDLLGHVSPQSMTVYRGVSDDERRQAVEAATRSRS